MEKSIKLNTSAVIIIGIILLTNFNLFSQGNSGGNANSNNNANSNALKWETQGNNVDTSHFIGTTNSADFKIKTNNTERMRITKDGKFGIGISNPLEKFELQGNLKLTGDIIFSNYEDLNDTLGKLLFVDQLGRTHPMSWNQLKTELYADRDKFCQPDLTNPNPIWNNGPNKIFSRCPEVYIGIGTDSPLKLLDVRGTTQTRKLEVGREYSNYSLISGYRTGVNNTFLLSLGQFNPQSQTEHIALELTSSGELNLNYNELIQGSTSKVFTINSVGDSRKLLQLENNGLLRARRIKIDQYIWADNVFESGYYLMPLNELKQFIAINGHLPEVPTTEEVEENGVDLAQTNALLLKKIEELTLYLLEQKEETETLKKELAELRVLINQQ
ncbi:MAG: hypothetical protein R3277_13405 [Brumimicrobium sp.]|nr:hypothetical protein [Brumimicrobium sp.]